MKNMALLQKSIYLCKKAVMKKSLILAACLAVAACSQKPYEGMDAPSKIVYLYPEGQNVDKGIVENGIAITEGPGESTCCEGGERCDSARVYFNTGDEARMEIYLPENCGGQMIINCPGGGYICTCCQSEGDFAAKWFTSKGVAVCTVIYRLPNGHCTAPLTDVQNAFRYCRHHAAEWGINQMGIIGYSAGGNLAASASTLFVDDITRPDFSVLIYPHISMVAASTEVTDACANNLTGGDPAKKEYYSLEKRVSPKTPMTMIYLSEDDGIVPPAQSLLYYSALMENGVKAGLHIFPKGYHGWGFNTMETAGYDMLEEYREEFFHSLEHFLKICRESL